MNCRCLHFSDWIAFQFETDGDLLLDRRQVVPVVSRSSSRPPRDLLAVFLPKKLIKTN